MDDPVTALFARLPDPMGDPRASTDTTATGMAFLLPFLSFKEDMSTRGSVDPDAKILLAYVNDIVEGRRKVYQFCSLLGRLALFKDPLEEGSLAKQRQLAYYRWISRGRKEEDYPFSSDGTLTRSPSNDPVSHEFLPRTPDSTRCAHCDKDSAPLKCGGCLVLIDKHVVFSTAYCSKECQVGHRKTHRAACRDWQRLGRASSMFQETLVELLKVTQTREWRTISEKDGMNVSVYEGLESRAFLGKHVLIPAEFEKAETPELALQTLMNGQCSTTVVDSRALFEIFFRRICKSAHVVSFQAKNMHRTILYGACTNSDGSARLEDVNADVLHQAIHITMPSGVEVSLDPTGVQYGWKDYLTPWDAFCQHRMHRLKKVTAMEPIPKAEWERLAGRLRLNGKYAVGELDSDPDSSYRSAVRLVNELLVSGLLWRTEILKSQGARAIEDLKGEEFDKMRTKIMDSVGDSLREALRVAHNLPFYRLYFEWDFAIRATVNAKFYRLMKHVWLGEEEYAELRDHPDELARVYASRVLEVDNQLFHS